MFWNQIDTCSVFQFVLSHERPSVRASRSPGRSKGSASSVRCASPPRLETLSEKASGKRKRSDEDSEKEDEDDDDEDAMEEMPAKKKKAKKDVEVEDFPMEFTMFEKGMNLSKFLLIRAKFGGELNKAFNRHGAAKPYLAKAEKAFQKLADCADRDDLDYEKKRDVLVKMNDQCIEHVKKVATCKQTQDPMSNQAKAIRDFEFLADAKLDFEETRTTMEQMRSSLNQEKVKAYRFDYNRILTLTEKLTRVKVDEQLANKFAADLYALTAADGSDSKALANFNSGLKVATVV
jgi:hypothetical protein